MKQIKKIIYIVLGCIEVGLGAVGAVVPLLSAFVLGVVWLFHILYFTFGVRNYRKETYLER